MFQAVFNDPGGVLYCSFTRNALTTITVPGGGGQNVDFDLNSKSYFLLTATGELGGGTGELTHHTSRAASTSVLNLGDYPLP